MNINKIINYKQYQQHQIDNDKSIQILKAIDANLNKKIKKNQQFHINGFSWTAQSKSKFLVDLQYSNTKTINLRERLVCNKTKLNNRVRGCIHIFESLFNPHLDDLIYLTEQSSLLARWMTKKYSNVIGSEYLKDCSMYSKIKLSLRLFPTKPFHQDLTNLSFKNNKFKYILSFDCFEHIPDYRKAFKEVYRTLSGNGKLLFSVPFDINNEINLVRATVEGGNIKHLVEAEYHGDPVSSKGCLSYYTFGWELLNELREVGFKKVYILLFWSDKYCYLGGEQIMICAEK